MRIKSFIALLLIFVFASSTASAVTPNLIYKGKYTDDEGYTYYLQRVYGGIPVYGEGVYLTFDGDGNLIYLHDGIGEGTFEKAENIIGMGDAMKGISFDILKPCYIKVGNIYRYVLKPDEFSIDASTGKLIMAEDDKVEIAGDSAIKWENEGAIGELEKILGQAGYSYSSKIYREFNGAENVTYISGNKDLSYLNVAIHENEPISIAFSAMHADEEYKDAGMQKAVAAAWMLYRKIVPEGNKAQMNSYETEKDYRIDFVRTENGIPVEDNGLYVVISKNGLLKSLSYRWDHADFEDIKNVNTSAILSRFIEAAEMELYYKKTGDRYIPVYTASKDIEYITPQGSLFLRPL